MDDVVICLDSGVLIKYLTAEESAALVVSSCGYTDSVAFVRQEVFVMESRGAVTIRFPAELLSQARETKAEKESLNEFVVDAVDREVRRRQGLAAYEEILRVREEIRAETGVQPDSTPMIRALREGIGRRD